ncbi:MAG: hypothetical protein P8L66_11180 [Rhodospirillaceae bacterium]|nr:hypothetical protein [Rhodospirillaceae bacterium]
MKRFAFFVSISLITALAANSSSATDGQAAITDTFCTSIQTSIMGNKVPAQNVVHPDYEAFVLSKASIDPLRNEQFTTLGKDGLPRMVSCKMKTPDHIQEVYGEDKANHEARACAAINRENVAAVLANLTQEEAKRRYLTDAQIIFEEDISVMTGSSWTKPFNFVTSGENGAIHIQSKRMQIDWTNILFKMAPDRFRGALYCHLIAPEYAKDLILGDADVHDPVKG